MRFDMEEDYIEDIGECWRLTDGNNEFGEWHSLSKEDLQHLIDFLNKQESEKMEYKRRLNTLKHKIRKMVE